MDKKNQPPHPKKPKLSLSLKKNRFKKASRSELQQMMKAKIPDINTRWAMKNFTDWLSDYNLRNPGSVYPEEVILPSCPAETLNKWLCVYAVETRSQSGEPYPPASLYSLLSGILRHMRSENPTYPNCLNGSLPEFSTFTTTLDNLMEDLRASGVGATSKHTEGISREEEELLWSTGILNNCTPMGLLRAVFFYNGKVFCPASTAQYNNCTVNMYQMPPPQQPPYFSPWMMPPFPSYPSYSIKNDNTPQPQ